MMRWDLATVLVVLCLAGIVRAEDKAEICVGVGHSGRVRGLSFSSDGRLLASGGGTAVRLWDVESRREIRSFGGHRGFVKAVCFSPDGGLLASSSNNGPVLLWDVETGRLQETIEHGNCVTQISFSPDGKWLATNRFGVMLRNLASGRRWSLNAGHYDAEGRYYSGVYAFAFSPDGKHVATCGCAANWSLDNKLYEVALFDAETGKRLKTLHQSSDKLKFLAFHPEGELLAFGSKNTLHLLQLRKDAAELLADSNSVKSSHFVTDLAFLPSGRVLAVPHHNGVRFWDVGTRRPLRGLEHRGLKPRPHDEGPSLACSGRAGLIATGYDREVRLWSLEGRTKLAKLQSYAASIGIEWPHAKGEPIDASPDGRSLAVAGINSVRTWDLTVGGLRRTTRFTPFYDNEANRIQSVTFDPRGRWLAVADDWTVRLLDSATGREISRVQTQGYLRSLACDRAGQTLATVEVANDFTVRWRSSIELSAVRGQVKTGGAPATLALSPDGGHVATAGSGLGDVPSRVQVWSLDSSKLVWEREIGFLFSSIAVAYSPDGRFLAAPGKVGKLARGYGGAVTVFDASSGATLYEVEIEPYLGEVAYSPDCRRLAIACQDGSVRLWDPSSKERPRTLHGHLDAVCGVAFLPDGESLVSASQDGMLKLWDVETGKLRVTMMASRTGEDHLAWTPEGYFAGTPAAEERVSVRIGNRAYALGQYRDRFYRPDLVARKLAGESIQAAATDRISDAKAPPEARFIAPERDLKSTRDTLDVTAESPDAKSLTLSVNGKVISPKSAAIATQVLRQSWTVQLAPGANEMAVFATSAEGVRSRTVRRTVTYEVPKEVEPSPLRPDLWLLGIAVSEYKDERYNLRFPVSDVKRLSEQFEAQQGRLYRKVHTKLLLDADATREEIGDARDSFLDRASTRDVVVVMIAGHGIRDKRGRFYFMTYDTDPTKPHRRAYPWWDFQRQLLEDLAPQKVLLLVDTCHAGGVGGDEQTRAVKAVRAGEMDLIADRMKEATGCYLFMASTTKEQALEGGKWGGGVFATAVLEALAGKAATPDGEITILRLIDYVDRRVIELTEHRQHPVYKIPSNARNFPLALKPD